MSAKAKWHRKAWWLVDHYEGERTMRRFGPTASDRKEAEDSAAQLNRARVALSFKESNPELALALGVGSKAKAEAKAAPALPSFREFAKRYLDEDCGHLADSTRQDRESMLREAGPLGYFGDVTLDAFDAAKLREWWGAEILGRRAADGTANPYHRSTGRAYVNVLAAVLAYARDLGISAADPIPAFREQLRRRSRTKGARAEAELGRQVRPIESPAELRRLVEAAEAEAERDLAQLFEVQREQATKRKRTMHERTGGLRSLVAVLAMLDAGLRMGEVTALTWGQIRFGEGENDRQRALVIDRSRPRGGRVGPPKSGRTRVVALSRRLRRSLLRLREAQFQPAPEAPVLPSFDPHNFAKRDWRRMLQRAEIGHRSPKDCRDTFASWLLSLGVQLGYVSRQLGHKDVAVTSEHYAKWVAGDTYREPMPLLPGEVPADLLARVVSEGTEAADGGAGRHPGGTGEDRARVGSRSDSANHAGLQVISGARDGD